MQPFKAIAATALVVTTLTEMAEAQDRKLVTLYDDTNYGGASKSFLTPWHKTCYNIWDCFDNRAASAKWSGFSDFFVSDMLISYSDADCKGTEYIVQPEQHWPVNGVANFGAAMNDRISSFSVLKDPPPFPGITGYTGYKCSTRRGGNETDAAVPLPVVTV